METKSMPQGQRLRVLRRTASSDAMQFLGPQLHAWSPEFLPGWNQFTLPSPTGPRACPLWYYHSRLHPFFVVHPQGRADRQSVSSRVGKMTNSTLGVLRTLCLMWGVWRPFWKSSWKHLALALIPWVGLILLPQFLPTQLVAVPPLSCRVEQTTGWTPINTCSRAPRPWGDIFI